MGTSSGEPGERILLVDRSGRLGAELREPLASAGYDVRRVETASECLEAIVAGAVDGVASEYELADLDGVRLVRAVRVSHPTLPFVLVPAEGSEELAADATEAGVSGYVPPAADAEAVLARLEDGFRQSRPWALGEGQERYRHLIELSPAPINVFDADGESIWCNDAALDLLGLSGRHELLGHSIFDFIHPDDHDRAREELVAVIERGESVGPTEMRLRQPDGGVRHVQVATATGQFLGAKVGQAVVLDVTERVHREQQLQVLDKWLRHNIRNETNLILGLAAAIEDGDVDDVVSVATDIREGATHLIEQANHQRSVIDLLTERPEPITVDVAAMVERQVERARESFPEATIEVRLETTREASGIHRLSEAIWEVVENAVHHADADRPTVRVTVEGEGDEVVVRVADDGPGIPPAEVESLQRGETGDPLHHGTGLGFLVVSWVVRLSGGSLSFGESGLGGSVVTLRLDAASPNERVNS